MHQDCSCPQTHYGDSVPKSGISGLIYTTPQLILVRGAPGSGKSTLAQMMFNFFLDVGNDVVMLSADDYRMREGEYVFNPEENAMVHRMCFDDTTHFLDRNYVVIVHNTFVRAWEMKKYIEHAIGSKIKWSVIECHANWGNVHNVPEETRQNMLKTFDSTSHLPWHP